MNKVQLLYVYKNVVRSTDGVCTRYTGIATHVIYLP